MIPQYRKQHDFFSLFLQNMATVCTREAATTFYLEASVGFCYGCYTMAPKKNIPDVPEIIGKPQNYLKKYSAVLHNKLQYQ